MEHREGPGPALDDRRGRDLRPAPGLGSSASAYRTHHGAHPPLPSARAVATVATRAAPLGRRAAVRSRLSTCAGCACPDRARCARCSTRSQPIATTSFDRARPLWEFTLFEGLDGPDGERAAFAMKVHHSVTDGVGGMELLAHMVDVARDAPDPSDADLPAAPQPEPMGTTALLRESGAHTGGASSGWLAACRVLRRTRPWVPYSIRSAPSPVPSAPPRSIGAHDRARDRPDVADHGRTRPRTTARRHRRVARRCQTRRQGDRVERQRRVRRGDHRRRAPLPRPARRRARSRCA